jgi:hypothetical protein
MSQVCYTNGTDGVDEAACEALAKNWNTAKFMYVAVSSIYLDLSLTVVQKR